MRGEFDLLKPDKPFRLRVELGGYWEPTQDRFGTSVIRKDDDNGLFT